MEQHSVSVASGCDVWIKSKEIPNQLTIMHNFYRTNILSMLSHPSILTKRIFLQNISDQNRETFTNSIST